MPDYTPEELAAIDSDRRRRVAAALRLGSAATLASGGPAWLAPLLVGLALALAAALVVGILTLAQGASRSGAGATPAVRTSP